MKWDAKKLLEDSKVKNDITAKPLNEILWHKFGVQMKQSTLYKKKTMALKGINGGHDESYG